MGAFSSLVVLNRYFSTHPLTCDAPYRAWLRFAAWQIRSRFQSEITFPWIGDQKLVIRHGMTGATCNIYAGLHEPFDMMVPIHFLRPGDLFLDIGANVGSFTVLASGVCKAKTFAFEPDPDTACHLKKNIDVNNLSDRVTVHQCALGAATGEIAFTVGQDTVNRIATSSDKHTRKVRIEKLDTVVAGYQPAMMKIDVEGAETDVLSGAGHLLANPCLKVIEIETLNAESENILTGNGFERAFYDPFKRVLSKTSQGNKSSNSLFVRDWAFVEERLASAPAITVLGRTI